MEKTGRNLVVFLCFFLLISFTLQAQTLTIEGKVMSTDQEPLPGATVLLSSPNLIGGVRTKITNTEGRYRFVGLMPGTYTLRVELQGFKPQLQEDLRLSEGRTLTVDFNLEVGGIDEEVTVIDTAPTIDIKDSQTVTTVMKTEYLQKLPNRGVESALSVTPGVHRRSAFGSATSNANSYMLNGVSVNDPEAGESGMNPSYDSVEEVNVMGIGAPAEYGGFSGAILNSVMKSGGNEYHGMANLYIRSPQLHSENWDEYPYLLRRAWDESYDANINLGGPIIKDKIWFFAEANYDNWALNIEDFDGLTESGDGWRAGAKLTWQIGDSDRLSTWLAYNPSTIYNYGAEPIMAPEANTDEEHWAFYYNGDFFHTFSDSTYMEVKFGGFFKEGKNTVDPNGPSPHFDIATEYLTGNFWETYYRYGHRIQENVTVTHHAENFIKGDHDFKFGAEVESSAVHVQYGYPGGRFYEDYNGPYMMFEWDGEEAFPKYTRISGFIQDSWAISDRLVINPGLRVNNWAGTVPEVSGTAFAPKIGIAPRIGFTFDIFGDNTTALKAHYGKYYHGLMVQFYYRLQPQGGFREYFWDGDQYVLDFEDTWEQEYTVDDDIKMPYMNQYVVGLEREVVKDVSVGASFIYRTNHDLLDRVNLTGMWQPTTWTAPYAGDFSGQTYTVYERLNPGDNQYLLTNPKEGEDYGAAFSDIVGFNPTRNYRGLQLTFTKRWSNNWMLDVSYTYSKAWGTNDNGWGEFGENRGSMLGASTLFSNPNFQINADGPLSLDPTHLLKVNGAVDIPVIDVTLGLHYNYSTGDPYTASLALPQGIDPDSTSWSNFVYIYGDERGTYRYPSMHTLELRVEKFFRLGDIRVGALADIFNAFNDDTVTEFETQQNPFSDYQFGYVWGIRSPRTFRLGLRVEF